MPLKEDMTHDEVIKYLTDDLRKSVRMDLYPAIQIGNPEGIGELMLPLKLILCRQSGRTGM